MVIGYMMRYILFKHDYYSLRFILCGGRRSWNPSDVYLSFDFSSIVSSFCFLSGRLDLFYNLEFFYLCRDLRVVIRWRKSFCCLLWSLFCLRLSLPSIWVWWCYHSRDWLSFSRKLLSYLVVHADLPSFRVYLEWRLVKLENDQDFLKVFQGYWSKSWLPVIMV